MSAIVPCSVSVRRSIPFRMPTMASSVATTSANASTGVMPTASAHPVLCCVARGASAIGWFIGSVRTDGGKLAAGTVRSPGGAEQASLHSGAGHCLSAG
jgi:hypothetical protein